MLDRAEEEGLRQVLRKNEKTPFLNRFENDLLKQILRRYGGAGSKPDPLGREEVTIRVSQAELGWAIRFLNDFIASKPVNTEPLAHAFVSALSSAIRT